MDDVKLNTSWSDDDLSSLCRIENHKIVKDRDSNYRWYHKLGGVWGVHSIWVFDDYRKPSNKILELNKLFPEYSKQELANELDVSLSTVQRALKRQNKKAQ